jgi:mannose-6-phosphate isomerase
MAGWATFVCANDVAGAAGGDPNLGAAAPARAVGMSAAEHHGAVTGPPPLLLPPNPVHRFYRGGDGIDQLRGVVAGSGPGAPEDWVGSTTTSLGNDREGLALLADGRLLRDVIAADPLGYLGAEHVSRWGANSGVLVKLLDAGERLAAHYHPGRAFARAQMGSRFGKTEAWIILSAEPGAHMHLGLREEIDRSVIERWVREQDSDKMLAALNVVPVAAGDVLFVPAGTIHTIGAGITLVELQEPTDMSVVLEWERYKVTGGEETLNLGWDLVLDAAEMRAGVPFRAPAPVAATPGSSSQRLLPEAADPYFRAERVTVNGHALTFAPGYSVLIALEGELSITCKGQAPLRLTRGQSALIPYGAGATTLDGHGSGIRCLPPAADSGEGKW